MKRRYKDSIIFQKQLKKLKGQQLYNTMHKINEILNCENLDHYKNLRNDLKKFKRCSKINLFLAHIFEKILFHVNNSYIILFFGDDDIVYFIDYEHHDKIYTKKYEKNYIKENL